MRQIKTTRTITSRTSEGTEKYLYTIGKIDRINPEEEARLAREIKAGNQFALDKLVKANLRFAVSVAKEFQQTTLDLDDLINEANEGLVKAATKFDETKGFKFISFAVWWIRQTIQQSLADNSRLVRLPVNKLSNTKKVNDQTSIFFSEHGRDPTEEELLEVTGIKKENLLLVQENDSWPLSLDAPLSEEEGGNMYDLLPGEETPAVYLETERESMQAHVHTALDNCLSSKERLAICLWYGIGRDCPLRAEDAATYMNCSGETVRKIHDRALEKLRVKHGDALRALFT